MKIEFVDHAGPSSPQSRIVDPITFRNPEVRRRCLMCGAKYKDETHDCRMTIALIDALKEVKRKKRTGREQ